MGRGTNLYYYLGGLTIACSCVSTLAAGFSFLHFKAFVMYTIETVRNLIATDQRWLQRAIVVLFEHQTTDEQKHETTLHTNGVGFNACDAPTLSYYAQYISSGRNLTGFHLDKARQMVPKYAGQILNLIKAKGHEPHTKKTPTTPQRGTRGIRRV